MDGGHTTNKELHVLVDEEMGVAASQQSEAVMERRYCRGCCTRNRRVNKKQIFGIVLLMLVVLIWVGSSGLTRAIFHLEAYDKPFFTVYFKTVLFTIYLLPFLFWRPWQRLCCSCCKATPSDTVVSNDSNTSPINDDDNEIGDDDVFEDNLIQEQDEEQDSSHNSNLLSSTESISNSGAYKLPLLGPSVYAPLRHNEESNNSRLAVSLPNAEQPTSAVITSSNTYLNKRRKPRVRFSQTVEVKHVPSVSSIDTSSTIDITTNIVQPVPLLSVRYVALLSVPFGLLWFFANYLYARALDNQSVAMVNTLSSLSGVFVLLLAAVPLPNISVSLKDRFTLTKLLVIVISVGGAVLVGLSSSNDNVSYINIGALYAVGSAALYACYLVLLSKAVPDEDGFEIPMFFGFVGVFVSILIAPLLVFWNYVNWETFELPPNNMVWTLLLINGFVGTVLSELLWLWGSLLTSSLVGTLSLSLVTPLSLIYSIFMGEISVSAMFIVGAILTIVAFICVALVDYWAGWDPAWQLIKRLYVLLKDYRNYRHFNDLSIKNESEYLLNPDNDNNIQ